MSANCLGLARRLVQTSSDSFAARLRLGSYPYGLGASRLGYPRLSVRRISRRFQTGGAGASSSRNKTGISVDEDGGRGFRGSRFVLI